LVILIKYLISIIAPYLVLLADFKGLTTTKKCTVIANYRNTTHFIASIAIVLFSYVLPPIVHNNILF